jgi:hypothetical protein
MPRCGPSARITPITERPLTAGEIGIARSVFGDAIDYEPVRISHRRWWPFQPREILMSPCGHVHVHPASSLWSEDYAAERIELQGLLLHELTHVLQAQERGRWYLPLMRHPFCRYRYEIEPGKPFDAYGLEQQGEIVRHVFFARNCRTLPGMAGIEPLEAIIRPRFGARPAAR